MFVSTVASALTALTVVFSAPAADPTPAPPAPAPPHSSTTPKPPNKEVQYAKQLYCTKFGACKPGDVVVVPPPQNVSNED